MNTPNHRPWLVGFAVLSLATVLSAQTPKIDFPLPSPISTLKQRIGVTDVEIIYSRPSLKDRAVFGSLVPYGEVWRTGANASTKISFSTPVKLNGTDVPAGDYALYTIPGEKEWTLIIHKNTSLRGAFNYNPKDDLVRFTATPIPLANPVESFTIGISDLRDESATLDLIWEKVCVPVKIEVDVTGKLVPEIESVMAPSGNKKPYLPAATFYYEHNLDLQKALQWVEAAIAESEVHYAVHLKAKILAKLGDKPGAIAAAQRSLELAAQAKDDSFVKLNQDLIASLR